MRRLKRAMLVLVPLLAIGAVLVTGETLSSPVPALIGERRVGAFLAAHLREPGA